MTSNAKTPMSKRGPFKPTIIIHGGAGNITQANLPPKLYAQYHASLTKYLTSTNDLLESGSNAVDAACHAVCMLEDDPLFNCGRGSVFSVDGEIEMEASLMVASVNDFRTSDANPSNDVSDFKRVAELMIPKDELLVGWKKRNAAVSMIKRTRHPILLAREVLRMPEDDLESNLGFAACRDGVTDLKEIYAGKGNMHGHLSGSWVEEWGFKERGLERKGRKWFWTKKRWEEHRRGLQLDCSHEAWLERLTQIESETNADEGDSCEESQDDNIYLDAVREIPSQGTVGTVCMDSWGNVCAATSTGGLTNKRAGRIGDTPTVGAGFWAESWSNTVKSIAPTNCTINIGKLLTSTIEGTRFWFQECLPGTSYEQLNMECSDSLATPEHERPLRARSFYPQTEMKWVERPAPGLQDSQQGTQVRAVAMSGTGNGDSFLRMNAVRTAAAIARFCSLKTTPVVSLQKGITNIVGPEGELQRSAGERWGKTGEGEGGIIGIEVIRTIGRAQDTVDASIAFDFNCGGMWRAYFETTPNGNKAPKVMVFKGDYQVDTVATTWN